MEKTLFVVQFPLCHVLVSSSPSHARQSQPRVCDVLSYTIPLSTQQGPLVKLCPTNVSASQDRCEDAMEILNVKMHLKQENNIEM